MFVVDKGLDTLGSRLQLNRVIPNGGDLFTFYGAPNRFITEGNVYNGTRDSPMFRITLRNAGASILVPVCHRHGVTIRVSNEEEVWIASTHPGKYTAWWT